MVEFLKVMVGYGVVGRGKGKLNYWEDRRKKRTHRRCKFIEVYAVYAAFQRLPLFLKTVTGTASVESTPSQKAEGVRALQ